MSGGGGGGTTYSEVEQTTTNLPKWAEPYYKDLLARTGYETSLPYEAYGGQRLAYFSPMEQEAFARYGQLGVSGTPAELDFAGQSAAALTQGWNPGINTGTVNSGYSGSTFNSGYNAGNLGMNYNPETRDSQYRAGQYDFGSDYNANQRNMGYEAGSLAEEGVLDPYMNPYYQNVVDIEKREAARQADMRHSQTGLDAAGLGSLGGYREAIMRSETERNLGQLQSDIQFRGSNEAFLNAQQAFEADRSARAQEETFGQSQFGMNEQLRIRQSELMQQGYSLREASRIAQEELTQSQYGMNQQALQAREGFTQSQFGMNQQAQQMQAQLQLSAFQASEQAKQAAAQMGLTAAQITQAGQIASAQILLGQDQNRLAATGMLGDFSLQRQDMEYQRLNMMQQAGLAQRGMMQAGLDTGYQDFLNQQNWGRDQLNFYAQMMYGLPITSGQTVTSTGQQPSNIQQMLGLGISGAGLYNAFSGGN